MEKTVIWVKPWNPEHHEPGREGHKGLCGWHGTGPQRGACGNTPYASVKLQYKDYAPVQSACAEARRTRPVSSIARIGSVYLSTCFCRVAFTHTKMRKEKNATGTPIKPMASQLGIPGV